MAAIHKASTTDSTIAKISPGTPKIAESPARGRARAPPSWPPGRYPAPVSNPSEVEARLAALEARMEEVAADAAAARHLAAARDRDLADLTIKVDANRQAINALGVQTAARFDQVDHRFDRLEGELGELRSEMRTRFDLVDNGFAEMRGRFDQTAAGMARIVELLTRRGDQ